MWVWKIVREKVCSEIISKSFWSRYGNDVVALAVRKSWDCQLLEGFGRVCGLKTSALFLLKYHGLRYHGIPGNHILPQDSLQYIVNFQQNLVLAEVCLWGLYSNLDGFGYRWKSKYKLKSMLRKSCKASST